MIFKNCYKFNRVFGPENVNKCHIASLFTLTAFNLKRASRSRTRTMGDTQNSDTNIRNSATEADPPLPHHNNGPFGNPGCSRLPNVQRGPRQESNILNTNIFAPFYARPTMYYYNYYNVSFNSSQGTSETRDNREIAEHQRQILGKYRKWVSLSAESPANSSYVTVLNYNVLAQDLLQENAHLYRNHSARACLWETRWNNLYREITSYNADIICLQEVQQSHLKNYYKQLENLGYVGIYKKRTGFRTDGCAIYYKKSVFKIIENTTVEFNQESNPLDRENVAIIARFSPLQHPKSEFVVATTHLLYNPKRMDVRLAQTQILLAEIERIAYNFKHNETRSEAYVPVIITGDFNSKPDSAVYKLIVEGRLKYDELANRTLAPIGNQTSFAPNGKLLIPPRLKITDNCQHYELIKSREDGKQLTRNEQLSLVNLRHTKRTLQNVEDFIPDARFFSTGTLSHNFRFLSAFKHVENNDFEATTHQNEWITVDYIFYSGKFNNNSGRIVENKLQLVSNYRIPTTTELKEIKYIPNFVVGSDHLPLLSKFRLID